MKHFSLKHVNNKNAAYGRETTKDIAQNEFNDRQII